MSDQQKFFLKLAAALAGGLGGWVVTLPTWNAALTPIAFGGLLMILASVFGGVFGVTSPAASQAVGIALLSGVHTQEDVKKIQTVTASGTVPTPEVAAAILAAPPPPITPSTTPPKP